MALSKRSVEKAIELFNQIEPATIGQDLREFSGHCDFGNQGKIFAIDRKEDGGWETVFMYVSSRDVQKLDLFDTVKRGIPNSSYVHGVAGGMVKIGWF